MDQKIVKSTLIQAYSYDDKNLTLSITFKNGTAIDYHGVPPSVMSVVFDRPGSIGSRFISQIVKRGYKYTKSV